jgi:hypothetical protein
MSKFNTIRAIKSEISRINKEIDLRIIKGISYRNLALRHKFLTNQLSQLAPRKSFFGSFSLASMF